MRKEEFLEKLEMLLSDISEEEREEAMAFYRSYFDDAGAGNEARIIAELESPENVAETIKRDLGMVTVSAQEEHFYEDASESYDNANYGNQQSSDTYYRWSENQHNNPYGNYTDNQQTEQGQEKRNNWWIPLIIVIAVLAFPGWFGVLMGIIGTIIGLSAALIGITFSMFVVGAVFVGLGIAMLAGLGAAIVSIPVGLAFVGSGLLILALALLLLLACVGVFGKFLPWACKGIINLCKKPFAKKEAQTV